MRQILAFLFAITVAFCSACHVNVAPDPRVEKAVLWAQSIAKDASHGYSQGAENASAKHPYTGSREGPDYDCSSLVYHAFTAGGFPVIDAWQKSEAFMKRYAGQQYSGDSDTLRDDLPASGPFEIIPYKEGVMKLQRGDVLYAKGHVAIYIGDGKTVEARGVQNPRGGDWVTGDQGGEIDFYEAAGRPWLEIYRFKR